MKQVTQRLRDGRVEVVDVPMPELVAGSILVDVRASVISVGTERDRTAAARSNLIGKARARPDQARQVLEKARRDGIRSTIDSVRMRLDQPSALGYSSSGVVIEVDELVRDISVGDRVACGGGGYAVHAEANVVPGNLCVRLPDGVYFEHGAFATIGSVALHAVRQADVRVGERVAVVGLGLLGQLAGQILRASGCHVVGVDLASDLVALAMSTGAADTSFERRALDGHIPPTAGDCDAVVVTAAAQSADPVELAARLCRDRARVVVVGDVQMAVPRAAYYDKELDIRLSRSYGPGRYDVEYEERGLDYPIGYVRWTERRNMAAFVELLSTERVCVEPLISKRVAIADAPSIYDELVTAAHSPLGIVIQYSRTEKREAPPQTASSQPKSELPAVGVIGAGSFAQRILIPGLVAAGFPLRAVASSAGLSAHAAVDRFGFGIAASVEELLADCSVGLVAIATRHSSHATLVAQALASGKEVFVEKPPCLTLDDLHALQSAAARAGKPVAVGFNRRYAPLARAMRDHVLAPGAPIELMYRINAAPMSTDHWLDDPSEGGGRLLGEGCHFVDFACWFVGAIAESVTCVMAPSSVGPLVASHAFSIGLRFADGSIATIVYGTAGSGDAGKEYVEAHAGGRSAAIDDYASLTTWGDRRKVIRDRARDKGHAAQFAHLAATHLGRAESTNPSPLETMEVTLAALQSALTGRATDPRGLAAARANVLAKSK